MISLLPQNLADQMFKNRSIRTAIVRESHYMFFNFYFSRYVKYPTAPFHREFFRLTENDNLKKIFIVSFRGSAKSSIFSMSYPLWAILGRPQKKFVLIVCQTIPQAKQHMMNLRHELEGNDLLKNDLGPFREENTEWGISSLVFSNSNARITSVSLGQSIRSSIHSENRPDLIIADDLEDMASVKTRESRQATYQWFTGEAIPAGDRNTKIVAIGNLLHEDSLLMRLKQDIDENRTDGIFRFYPLVNENNQVLWPGKYPTEKDIEEEKRKIGNEIAWQREFLLKIIPEDDQVIRREWICYYEELPSINQDDYQYTWAGMDLAISEKSTADYTAIVAAQVHGQRRKRKIYILSNPVNKRMMFPDLVDFCRNYLRNFLHGGKLIIENVAFQASLAQLLHHEGRYVEGASVKGDKRSRLAFTSPLIQNGTILFPKKGAEELIQQLVGFGVEKHDDLVDAFTILIHKFSEDDDKPRPNVWFGTRHGFEPSIKYDDEWEDENEDKRVDEIKNEKENESAEKIKKRKEICTKESGPITYTWKPSVFEDDGSDFEIDSRKLFGFRK